MDEVQKEMKFNINHGNQRSNVDSAKKLACVQRMDYEGFRQMVLGANLYNIKQGQVASIFDYRATGFNSTAKVAGKNQVDNEDIVRNTLGIDLTDALDTPKNVCEFEKFFLKRCQDSMQRYTYLRLIQFENYSRIFGG